MSYGSVNTDVHSREWRMLMGWIPAAYHKNFEMAKWFREARRRDFNWSLESLEAIWRSSNASCIKKRQE